MPDRWQTYGVEFRGGLISNLSPLQHGTAAPGSARVMNNFEPSTEGGYRRIEGFSKYNTNTVTGQGNMLGVVLYKDSAIVARDQSGGNPKLFSGGSGSGSWTDLSTTHTLGANVARVRFAKYNFDGADKLFIVDGVGYPLILSSTIASGLSKLTTPSDLQGASHAVAFKNHIFAANGENLVFSAPFEDDDFTAASGGGIINVGTTVTDLIVFREQLIVFGEDKILRIVGSSIADFQMQPIADDVGCVESDTAQEISGDVIFLGPDGLRTVAATERNQDFELASVSKTIQKQMVQLTSQNTSFASVVIREKSQYRLFGFTGSASAGTSKGIIGTQVQDQQGIGLNWAETTGIKAFVADSTYSGTSETILFAHTDGYVYKMESGNSFDGGNIVASFSTPYFPVSDARLRKTIYKTTVYTDPQGTIDLSLNLKYDLSESGVIEPDTITLENTSSSGGAFIYGEPNTIYNTATYSGETLKSIFDNQAQGSGFTVSLQFESNDTNPPYSLDAAVLEYGQYGRR